jgi:orotidine-5'-phosphate decarboxylase
MQDEIADDRLIVAVDLPDALAGLKLAGRLGGAVSFYKIGLGMLTGGGLALARELKDDHGKRVFLDLKLFDIGATIETVVRAAAAGAAGSGMGILAVTVLTSADRADLDAGQIRPGDVGEIVLARAAAAFEAGADGVVASPDEAAAIRALPAASGRLIVTPGVRPAGAPRDDQKRVATPAEAIHAGADHIVVGRPIWRAADPQAAARDIVESLPGRTV